MSVSPGPPAAAPPPPPPPPAYSLVQRSRHVVGVHQDSAVPARPLRWVIPGGVTAVVAAVLFILTAYVTYGPATLDRTTGNVLLAGLFVVYVGGVYAFSYGWEVENTGKALKLTAIIVVATVAIVFVAAAVVAVAGALGKGSGGGKRSSSGGGSGGGGGGGGSAVLAPFIFVGGGGRTRTIVNNVVQPITCPACHQEFVPAKGAELQCPHCGAVLEAHQRPVTCPYCSQAYVPADNGFRCPGCGAPTPPSLLVAVAAPPDAPPQA